MMIKPLAFVWFGIGKSKNMQMSYESEYSQMMHKHSNTIPTLWDIFTRPHHTIAYRYVHNDQRVLSFHVQFIATSRVRDNKNYHYDLHKSRHIMISLVYERIVVVLCSVISSLIMIEKCHVKCETGPEQLILNGRYGIMTSSNGNIFSRMWPFVWRIERSTANFPHRGSKAELWCFLWSAP